MEISKSFDRYNKQGNGATENKSNSSKMSARVEVFERVWKNIEGILDQIEGSFTENGPEVKTTAPIKKSTLKVFPFTYR